MRPGRGLGVEGEPAEPGDRQSQRLGELGRACSTRGARPRRAASTSLRRSFSRPETPLPRKMMSVARRRRDRLGLEPLPLGGLGLLLRLELLPARSRSASTAASPCQRRLVLDPVPGRALAAPSPSPTRWISASCSGESRPCVTIARSMSLVLGSSAGGIRSRRPNQTFAKRVRGPAAASLISSRVIGRKSPASMPIDFEALGFGAVAGDRPPAHPRGRLWWADALAGTPAETAGEAWAFRGAGSPMTRRDGGSAAGRGSIEAQEPPNQPVEKAHRADLSRRPGERRRPPPG